MARGVRRLHVQECAPGVYRLGLGDVDMEKRKSKEGLFPPG